MSWGAEIVQSHALASRDRERTFYWTFRLLAQPLNPFVPPSIIIRYSIIFFPYLHLQLFLWTYIFLFSSEKSPLWHCGKIEQNESTVWSLSFFCSSSRTQEWRECLPLGRFRRVTGPHNFPAIKVAWHKVMVLLLFFPILGKKTPWYYLMAFRRFFPYFLFNCVLTTFSPLQSNYSFQACRNDSS